jgi:hypothetical protein
MLSHRGRRDDDRDVSSDPEQQLRRVAGNLEKRRHNQQGETDHHKGPRQGGSSRSTRHSLSPLGHIITSGTTGETQGKTTHGHRGKYNYIQPGKQNKQEQEDEDEDEDEDEGIKDKDAIQPGKQNKQEQEDEDNDEDEDEDKDENEHEDKGIEDEDKDEEEDKDEDEDEDKNKDKDKDIKYRREVQAKQ